MMKTEVIRKGPSIGKCALCRRPASLRDSHLLPKAVYRLLRDPTRRNPNPVVITRNGKATTSEQVSKHFLCSECEQRFSNNGENFVMAQCARRDGHFALREELQHTKPLDEFADGVRVYDLDLAQPDGIEYYTYFSASVIWRAAATSWQQDGRRFGPLPLGPYLEPLRRYLIGESVFPQDIFINLKVLSESKPDMTVVFPYMTRLDACRRHTFAIPGIFFYVFVGNRVAQDNRDGSLTTPGPKVAFLGGLRDSPLFEKMLTLVKTSPRRGSLRKRPESHR